MSSIHPVRTSPATHHLRKTVARAARSAPVSKTALKGSKVKPAKQEEEIVDSFDDDSDDMGSSFLQFCCRRKDANIHDNDPSLSFMPSLLTSPIYDGDEPLGFGTRTILPHKLPTPCPLSTRIPAIAHDGKSDLDPTEWKPCEEGSSKEKPGGEGKGSAWRPKLAHRPSSEAHTYLSQFHRSVPASTRRPGLPNRSTPSLSHTPTTTASSDNSMAGTPTEIAEQPLMPRADTILPKSAGVKGAELVTPKLASMAITAQVDSVKGDGMDNSLVHDISYDKKWVLNRKASAAGSLKKLLGRDEVDSTALAM